VLEFILYKQPPNPVTAYQTAFTQAGINCQLVALAPTLDKIMDRIQQRGRENDLTNLAARRKNALHQLDCLDATYIQPYVIDSTDMSLDELNSYCKQLFDRNN
jgi:hypothetical protein